VQQQFDDRCMAVVRGEMQRAPSVRVERSREAVVIDNSAATSSVSPLFAAAWTSS
jgi:hypothetical protein